MKKYLYLCFFLFTFNGVFSQRVYITKTGEKYHDVDCIHLKRSSNSISLEEAIQRKYDACKVCKPNKSKNEVTKSNFISNERVEKTRYSVSSTQCNGRTKKGLRCKRMTTNSNGKCYQH